jgi:hypothetical protein
MWGKHVGESALKEGSKKGTFGAFIFSPATFLILAESDLIFITDFLATLFTTPFPLRGFAWSAVRAISMDSCDNNLFLLWFA